MATKEQRRKWDMNYRRSPRYESYAKNQLARVKEKYRTDPAFREARKKYAKKRAQDPVVRERRRQLAQRPESKIKTKEYNDRRRAIVRNCRLKSKYGITLDDFAVILASQNGVCALCGCAETHQDKWNSPFRNLRVDHSHATGKVRGLLCHHCNAGLGHFKDSPELLARASTYLRDHES